MSQTATTAVCGLQHLPLPVTVSRAASNGPAPSDEEPQRSEAQSLPPHDGGTAAWRLLLSAFVFEALLWGFPLSFGVFQNYYSQLPQFKENSFVSVIGTVASGLTYMAAPIIIPFIKRFPWWRRRMIWIGWPLCLLGLIAGSFATTLETLILTQGVMYGLGFTVSEYPIISMVNEFWVARRGMAYGLLCASSGVSGAAFPFAIEQLLMRYGYRTTLRSMAIGLLILTGPLMTFFKGRLPDSENSATAAGRTDWSFLKTRLFWVYSTSNLAMGFGYFFPSVYLPSYATANGLSSTQGALLLAIMSISQVLGQITFGYLSDQNLPLNVLTISSSLIAGVAAYTCWGLAHNFTLLALFAVIYGFFGAGYTALWSRMGTKISRTAAFTAFGLLNFGKGVGNVLAGPIGGALLKHSVVVEQYGAGRYKEVVLFVGSAMVLSALIIAFQDLQLAKPMSLRRW